MTSWQPTATIEVLKLRAQIVTRIRAYFHNQAMIEVETPILSRFGITDPAIESISVETNAESGSMFLATSPEYAMKRLLAAGSPDIFQICKVFRAHESGARHRREFTMIEWYRHEQTMADAIKETFRLCEVAGIVATQAPMQVSYRQAFENACEVNPLTADVDRLQKVAEHFLPESINSIRSQLGHDRQAWLDLLLGFIVIPGLPPDRLTAIYHYPADQAALARLDPENKNVAERFEIFFGDIELANGYRELTDANEQRQRFEIDQRIRQRDKKTNMQPDTLLLEALDHTLPECSGVALGLDRLIMAVTGLDDIAATISFAN